MTTMRIFERESAARKRKFMVKGLMVKVKWKVKKGRAKKATRRLMASGCASGVDGDDDDDEEERRREVVCI
ncbi:uncharacterized protein A4U43_C10F5140 [Asparagus officinalis]|uniref:Uncharacterized protein n=1 Tax=Asparagus officinalis TaxID=4686 RepID=A0A5P1E133_ASPOF|nr:uncharacterized protein A4U43_C10F5140 [Asparagus officinalis]